MRICGLDRAHSDAKSRSGPQVFLNKGGVRGRALDAAAAGTGSSKGGRVAAGKHFCLYDGSPADSAGSTECK